MWLLHKHFFSDFQYIKLPSWGFQKKVSSPCCWKGAVKTWNSFLLREVIIEVDSPDLSGSVEMFFLEYIY